MKNILIAAFLFYSVSGYAQSSGATTNPSSRFQPFNKSPFANGAIPLDAKYMYNDADHFITRPFISVAEANAYLPSIQRYVGLTVLVNSGGTLNTGTGILTGGKSEDYQYKTGTNDVDLVLKIGYDTTTIKNRGGGIQLVNNISNSPTKVWEFRSFINGTNTTVRLVGDTAIAIDATGGGSVDPTLNTNFTGVNTFTNSLLPVRIRRNVTGPAIQIEGPSGTNYTTIGTDPDFGFPSILSSGRLDVRANSTDNLFLGGKNIMAEANLNVGRNGNGVTSTGTQKTSHDLVFENLMWNPTTSSAFYLYNGIQSRASTTQAGVSSLVFRVGSPANPDLNDGTDALELSTTGGVRFGMLGRGGPDSALFVDASGNVIKKAISSGGGDMYLANNNAMTGTNTIGNAGRGLTINRSTVGSGLRVAGPSGTNFMDFGTNTDFGYNEITSNGRLDISPATNLYLNSPITWAGGHFAVKRKGDATSVLTQQYSRDFVFENHLWNPTTSSAYYLYSGWQARAYTDKAGKTSLVARLESPVNPDLNDGKDAFEMTTDSIYKFNLMNKGGSQDSGLAVTPTGVLRKTNPEYGKAFGFFSSTPKLIVPDSVGSVYMTSTDTLMLPDPAVNKNRILYVHNANVSDCKVFTTGKALNTNGGVIYATGSIASNLLPASQDWILQCNNGGTQWHALVYDRKPPNTLTPTNSLLSNFGTGATISISGNEISGTVTIVSGTSPLASAATFNLVFVTSYGSTAVCSLTPQTAVSAALLPYAIVSTTQMIAGVSPVAASTTYKFSYVITP